MESGDGKSGGKSGDRAMVLTRGLVNASRCNSCRLAILRSFVPTADLSSRSGVPLALPFGDARVHPGVQERSFSKSRSILSDYVPQGPTAGKNVQGVCGNGESPPADGGSSSSSASPTERVPWYLQVETPRRAPPSISNCQRIPDINAGSPPLLQPLLEHVFVDLGLDDLTIIDLRNLDPPPALGANLMMILGTARSEKHLHVSADRLCRWLRSDHNLTPFADGLLGRNELKLKLKRKARRSKLLGSVGASERDGMDDGLRTGWICVDVGRVRGEDHGISDPAAVDGFVGFGSRFQGVRLVVQMLTKEKREELDLEGLWGEMLGRKARRDAKTEELATRAAEVRPTEKHVDTCTRGFSKVQPTHTAYFQSPATRPQTPQTRSLCTSARHLTEMPSVQAAATLGNDIAAARPNGSPISRNILNESIMRSLVSAVDAGDYHCVCRILCNIGPSVLKQAVGDGGKELLLRAHLNHLRSLPHEEALELLGDSPSIHLSSPFLFSFYQSLPTFPDPQHWQCQVELLCYGMELGHRRCTKSGLMMLFSQMCLSGVDIPVTAFLAILQSVLSENGILAGWEKWNSDVQMAVHVLKEMNRRGHDILTEDIFVLLLERVNRPDADDIGSNAVTAKQRLNDIIFAYDIPLTKEKSLLRILPLYASQGDWINFWLLWKGIAMRALRRTEALYGLMFRSIARTSNQAQCMHALRMRVPDMEIEEPPVQLTGDVALAVKECLVAAVPSVSEDAQKMPLVDGEWARLWRRCEHGLRQSTY